jgi:acyl carrier protein
MQNGHVTPDQIRSEIKKLIASVTERDPEDIPDTASFTDELGVDSLMAMEVMVAMDKRFKIDIPEEEFTKATNVEQAVSMVQRFLPSVAVITAGA